MSPSLIHRPSDLCRPTEAGPKVTVSASPYEAAQGELAHTSASAAAASITIPPSVSAFASPEAVEPAVFMLAPSSLDPCVARLPVSIAVRLAAQPARMIQVWR